MAESEKVAGVDFTAPPKVEEGTGVALFGDYPVNHRLRAEALSKDGKAEDPDGVVSPELIADAGERLAADAKAEEAENSAAAKEAKRLRSMSATALLKEAQEGGIAVETDDNKPDLIGKIEAHRAGAPFPPADASKEG